MAGDQAVENFAGGCADWDRKTVDQAVAFLATQTATNTAEKPLQPLARYNYLPLVPRG